MWLQHNTIVVKKDVDNLSLSLSDSTVSMCGDHRGNITHIKKSI